MLVPINVYEPRIELWRQGCSHLLHATNIPLKKMTPTRLATRVASFRDRKTLSREEGTLCTMDQHLPYGPLGVQMRVLNSHDAKDTDAVCSQSAPEGTHTT
jgi:hypothetical protein